MSTQNKYSSNNGDEVNQTDAEIKIQYENNADTNVFTDSEKTKLTNTPTSFASTDAQKNSDITKAEIEAKLTGTIDTHKHNSTEYDNGAESGAVSLDFSNGDYQQIATIASTPITSLTMINSNAGDWLVVEIDNANATTVTVNSIEIIEAAETGKYLITIGNVSGTIKFINSKSEVI